MVLIDETEISNSSFLGSFEKIERNLRLFQPQKKAWRPKSLRSGLKLTLLGYANVNLVKLSPVIIWYRLNMCRIIFSLNRKFLRWTALLTLFQGNSGMEHPGTSWSSNSKMYIVSKLTLNDLKWPWVVTLFENRSNDSKLDCYDFRNNSLFGLYI